MAELDLQPQFRVTAAKRTASSSCCGAKLHVVGPEAVWHCRECGRPCDRVLSEPEVTTHEGACG